MCSSLSKSRQTSLMHSFKQQRYFNESLYDYPVGNDDEHVEKDEDTTYPIQASTTLTINEPVFIPPSIKIKSRGKKGIFGSIKSFLCN